MIFSEHDGRGRRNLRRVGSFISPSMNDTSLSLLCQLQQSSDADAWERLHRIYAPLIQKWLVRYDMQESDAHDVAQEVLLAVSKGIDAFSHNGRAGAFRAWVKGILVNRLREFWRKRDRQTTGTGGSAMNQQMADLDDPASQMTVIWNKHHDQHVLRELLSILSVSLLQAHHLRLQFAHLRH